MSLSSITCLVVESDSQRAEQILDHLKFSDSVEFLCYHAANLREAKRSLVRTKADLVISKGVLPEADHLDILSRFRFGDAEPLVICLLEDEEQSVILDASKNGADDYLFYKDLNEASLLESITHAFERRELLDELKSVQSGPGEGKAVYRGLLHCLDVALFVVSRPDGELLFNNKVADAWFGESKSSTLMELFDYGILEADAIEVEVATEAVAVPNAELRAVQLEWKGRDCSLVTLRNISKRKRAEEAYRSSQRRLDLAIKASNLGLWSWNLRENQLHFSEQWKGQLGYSGSEFPSTVSTFREHLHPSDAEEVETVFSQVLRCEISEVELKYRMRCKDGGYRRFLCRAECFPDDSGRLSSLVGSHVDITEAAGASFETSLSGKLSVRMERIAAEIEDNARQLKENFRGDSAIVERIQELERLSSSFTCLNEVLQLDAPNSDHALEPIDLSSELEELYRAQSSLLPAKTEIVLAEQEEIHVHGMSRRNLLFALTEALVCVRDAVNPDFRSRIRVSTFHDAGKGGCACVQLRYMGNAISNAELLALSKTPLVSVSSSVGTSTAELRVYFGSEDKPRNEADKERSLALLAEDEGVLRLAIRTMLESLGYEVVIAKDGEEAVEEYARLKTELDLVLVDMQMPYVDGYGVVSSIRATDEELPIIRMSGDTNDEYADRLPLDDDFSTFLSKPFGISDLKNAVDTIAKRAIV
ncbi:response regulator [Pelagicoccus mobilis]|uniref:Response regulator n=1 Tax=Pelagicoccus mobilis TaxID=415221 RepID=A0A934VNK1_9BACT|nr:response regulator [Pelagicoccus mobilis]MBK1876307.1 response regulator [Pelagicoccus mobilis]